MAKRDKFDLNEYFKKVSERARRRGFFARISAYNGEVADFMPYYYDKARTGGVIIKGPLKNPDQSNIAYYNEKMGAAFRIDKGFIENALQKWLPRITFKARTNLAGALLRVLTKLKTEGKTESIIKSTYIKLMCWLYYKFERIIGELGKDDPPKILAEGGVTYHELLLLAVLNSAGCDVLIVMTGGEAAYLEVDPSGAMSELIPIEGGPFPEDYSSYKAAEQKAKKETKLAQYGGAPKSAATNAYLKGGDIFEEVQSAPSERSMSEDYFFNTFVRIIGAEDKAAYESQLMRLEQYFKAQNRGPVIVEGQIPAPTNAEISAVKRGNYSSPAQAAEALTREIKLKGELKGILDGAFEYALSTVMNEPGINASRITAYGVTILCWLNRYFKALYSDWQRNISGFFYLGNKISVKDGLFLKFLSRTPVDVVILSPNLEMITEFDDPKLYNVHNPYSLSLEKFPSAERGARIGTAGYHAERELDTLMYQNSGFYRDKQFKHADTAVLNTLYEEIPVLWDEELKYRPNFAENGDSVTIPVVFAKVSGVKDGDASKYWDGIEHLLTPDTLVVKKVPKVPNNAPNPLKSDAVDFIKNGRLNKNKIMAHKDYKYGFLRDSMQHYLLDTLQEFLNRKPIAGMFQNGTEYTVIATALNLDMDVMRMINKFDFTKKNPKLIYIITDEGQLSLEDTIQSAFLSALGFDVIYFVPTGYNSVEKYFADGAGPLEHQIGDYLYDLRIPALKAKSAKKGKSVFDFFKRK